MKFFLSLQTWFYDNCMVLKPGNPDESDLVLEDSTEILSAEEYTVLGVRIDNSK